MSAQKCNFRGEIKYLPDNPSYVQLWHIITNITINQGRGNTYRFRPYRYEIAKTWNKAMTRRGIFPLFSSNTIKT